MTFIRDDVLALFNVDDYYQVLRVSPDASEQELKKAYLSRCLECHPDKAREPGQKEESHRRFQLLSEIYQCLSEPYSRQQYDIQQHQNRLYSPVQLLSSSSGGSSALVCDEIKLSECRLEEQDQSFTYACRCSGLFRVEKSQLVSGGCVRSAGAQQNVFIVNCDSCSESIKIVP